MLYFGLRNNKNVYARIGGFLCILLANSTSVNAANTPVTSADKPHNIIYLIGDGMGSPHTTAYRYYKANAQGKVRGDKSKIPSTEFDKHLVGMASTYPADDTLVTDSAAGATALATGFKSYNGAIGVTPDQQSQLTLLERAKQLGMATGVVATAQINHATPASFIAHIDHRKKYDEIADQYISSTSNSVLNDTIVTDVMLGGGTKYFDRESRKLVKEFTQQGFQYIDSMSDLDSLKKLPVLGLFSEEGMPFAIDSEQPNRLTAMSKAALRLVENAPKGFFLMLEGSQVDWCSHGNDIACAMAEMTDFEATLKLAVDFAKQNGNTTVVVTADHSTGGLTLGRDGKYVWQAELVHKIKISSGHFSSLVKEGQSIKDVWEKYIDLPLEKDELAKLVKASESEKQYALSNAISKLTAKKTGTGWTTGGHTGEDVQVFAFGPHKDMFVGFQDNTDIAKKLFSLLPKK
ncbi:alkaline phosphatase [Psychrosphaera sp. B3R10]|uniref:alkaline phosphatase n=1 Tax=unclassified Psychrosphaera TaxID=2641570 RepID=UPI001C092EAF|nr:MULTISPECIES: alkaline phosphatase [unclassified Psychrosphaera]MBU2883877.1 alkaline phosphatase [Psychrosphaera sp. I2R16]MBU2988740.1 alkaline phosphatase [Psychrosphaera sp. B3R10]